MPIKAIAKIATPRTFNHSTLFPYINYHRPCYFPKTITDSKGKDKKTYPYEGMMTPYDKLKSIENAKNYPD